jgi:prophage antirepressor-like protein
MSNDPIKNFEGHEIRVASTAQGPMFVAADVCAVLGLANTAKAVGALDEDEKGITQTDTLGGPQQMLAVTESGLYHLIFKSRKEAARRFRRWVTETVLPEIRQNGSYLHASTGDPFRDALGFAQRQVAEEYRQFLDAKQRFENSRSRRSRMIGTLLNQDCQHGIPIDFVIVPSVPTAIEDMVMEMRERVGCNSANARRAISFATSIGVLVQVEGGMIVGPEASTSTKSIA